MAQRQMSRPASVIAFCIASTLSVSLGVGSIVPVATMASDVRPAVSGAVPRLPHVIIETDLGELEAAVEIVRAPKTAANFLRYVEGGYYDGGRVFRTVRPDNQPSDTYKIQVIQIAANADTLAIKTFPAVPLERTLDTGLRHLDGSLSMARTSPDTATHSFSIVIGDQPSMDLGGLRNADGQGFAVFGRVVRGMDVARTIQALPADGQRLLTPVMIRRIRVSSDRSVGRGSSNGILVPN